MCGVPAGQTGMPECVERKRAHLRLDTGFHVLFFSAGGSMCALRVGAGKNDPATSSASRISRTAAARVERGIRPGRSSLAILDC